MSLRDHVEDLIVHRTDLRELRELSGVVVLHIADPPPWRSSQPEPCDLVGFEWQE